MELKNPYFEILNNFWTLLKPYANADDAEAYKKIMSDEYRLLTKDRGEKFTDAWWNSTRDIIDYPEKFRHTRYSDFAAELSIAIIDYWQEEQRGREKPYLIFMRFVGEAFIKEWERMREVRT